MRTLHAYLMRQILATLLITVMVFTFVLLLGNALKEILPLLVNRQVTLGVVVEAAGLLVPFAWVFALPMGMLTATLLVFGRFSADQELTAVRASGISLLSLISPILLLSLALCALSALVNMEIGPRCRVAYTNILFKLGLELTGAQLPEDRYIKDFKGFIFHVGKNRHGDLEDVSVWVLKDGTNVMSYVRARRGKVEVDTPNRRVNLYLYNGTSEIRHEGESELGAFTELEPIQLDFGKKQNTFSPKISDMTSSQLWDELHEWEHLLNVPGAVGAASAEQLRAQKRELQKMQALKAMGVRFSMDDFGTGYSSLSYLTRLPLDQLKIDQSFVRNIDQQATDLVVVDTIIGLASNLGLEVIAEGVETTLQRDLLLEHGCRLCQGYLFGKPMPVQAFEAWLIPNRIAL